MIIAQVFTNMLFVFLRTLVRSKIAVEFPTSKDWLSDFVSTFEIELLMNVFSQHFNLLFIYTCLRSVPSMKPFIEKGNNALVMNVNLVMQIIQALIVILLIFFNIRNKVSWVWHKYGPKFFWTITIINFVIIPILSMIWWRIMAQTTFVDCDLAAWFAVYPLMCPFILFPQYIMIVRSIQDALQVQFDDEDAEESERILQLELEPTAEDDLQ